MVNHSNAHAYRQETKAVDEYLSALTPGRGGYRPRRTPQELQVEIDAEKNPIRKLALVQQRLNIENALNGKVLKMEELTESFVAVAASFAKRKGISYAAWREMGVPPKILKEAGITK